jgi:hypothetical protein
MASDRVDSAWRLLTTTNEWVRFADAKAGGALAGAGVLGAALFQAATRDNSSHGLDAAVFFACASGVALFGTAILALAALIPRLRVGEPVSLIYFEHVARRYRSDPAGHADAVKSLVDDEDALFREVASQVWANSVVARKKFLCSGWSIFALGLATVCASTAAVIVTIWGK